MTENASAGQRETFSALVAIDQQLGFEIPRPAGQPPPPQPLVLPNVGEPPGDAPATPPRVLLDANILFAAPLRNIVLAFALAGLIRPYWSAMIQDEWTRARRRQDPRLKEERVVLLRALIDHLLPDAPIAGFQHRIEALRLRDRNDRHVLAAALEGDVALIATRNRKDFRPRDLAPLGVQAVDPDEVIGPAAAADPARALWAVRVHRAALGQPGLARYHLTLRRERLHRLIRVIRSDGV